MISSKVRKHIEEHLKKLIAGKREENLTYRWIFAILKIEMWKTPASSLKIIGQSFVIKGTLNRKVSSVRSGASTIKNDHRLKISKKFYQKKRKKYFLWSTKVFLYNRYFKPAIVIYCGGSGATII